MEIINPNTIKHPVYISADGAIIESHYEFDTWDDLVQPVRSVIRVGVWNQIFHVLIGEGATYETYI